MRKVYRRIYQEHNVRGLSLDIDKNTENRTYIVAQRAGNFIYHLFSLFCHTDNFIYPRLELEYDRSP